MIIYHKDSMGDMFKISDVSRIAILPQIHNETTIELYTEDKDDKRDEGRILAFPKNSEIYIEPESVSLYEMECAATQKVYETGTTELLKSIIK